MVRVVPRGKYRINIYVELDEPHHRPRCHVYWPDGSAAVDLATGLVLKHAELPDEARGLFEDYRTILVQAWNRLNDKD